MHPRARRLMADAELMRTEFAGHPYITVEPMGWEPPEQYRVTYHLLGVRTDETSGQPVTADTHVIVISLPAAYPREKPYSTAQTPVFHPNFGPKAGDEICIGDYWTPSQTLADIVVKVGEMLQFREYNVRSPLNAVAARWVAENESIFPIGDIGLYQAEPEISLGAAGAEDEAEPKMELTLDDDDLIADDEQESDQDEGDHATARTAEDGSEHPDTEDSDEGASTEDATASDDDGEDGETQVSVA